MYNPALSLIKKKESKMKRSKRLIAQILILAIILSVVSISASAAAPAPKNNIPDQQQVRIALVVQGMSGSGSVSTSQMTIYYPPGMVGTIQITVNGVAVSTVNADGSGCYQGGIGTLTARSYGLALVAMVGSTPTIVAAGSMIIAS
jgi:hypothetical protein